MKYISKIIERINLNYVRLVQVKKLNKSTLE